MMRITRLLAGFAAVASLAEAQKPAKYTKSIALSYELLSDASGTSSPLATVEYDHRSLEYVLSSWTPPSVDSLKSTSKEETSAPLLQVLLPNGVSTLASLKTFDPNLSQDIDVWISRESGEVISASVRSESPPPLSKEEESQRQKEERLKKRGKEVPSSKPKPKPKSKQIKEVVVEEKKAGPQVRVNLHVAGQGPVPKFNTRQPPQMDAEGNEIVQEEQQEKSFFQKYWYVLLALAFVLVTSGGGGKE